MTSTFLVIPVFFSSPLSFPCTFLSSVIPQLDRGNYGCPVHKLNVTKKKAPQMSGFKIICRKGEWHSHDTLSAVFGYSAVFAAAALPADFTRLPVAKTV